VKGGADPGTATSTTAAALHVCPRSRRGKRTEAQIRGAADADARTAGSVLVQDAAEHLQLAALRAVLCWWARHPRRIAAQSTTRRRCPRLAVARRHGLPGELPQLPECCDLLLPPGRLRLAFGEATPLVVEEGAVKVYGRGG